MGIGCAVLMCHAPIVIPAIGGKRSSNCAKTTAAMRRTAEILVASDPDVLVILSPHTARARTAWAIVEGDAIVGDFGKFGASEVDIHLPIARDAVEKLHLACKAAQVPTYRLALEALDHGAHVPLHFVRNAGWHGPTILIALPWSDMKQEDAMGRAIAQASEGQTWAVLASGDMSHRLKPGAPAGHHPRAVDFDAAFTERITRGDYQGAAHIDEALRELAAEDVVQTTAVAAAAVDWKSDNHQTLSYEGPFGVGYLEAVLYRA